MLARLTSAFEREVTVPKEAYAKRMLFVGEELFAFDGKEEFAATVLGIDEQGGLLVCTKDGAHRTLTAGEVTFHKEYHS